MQRDPKCWSVAHDYLRTKSLSMAHTAGFDVTKVPMMEVNCWTDWRTPCKRLAKHRELRLCSSESTWAVNARTASAFGGEAVREVKKSFFCFGDNDF